MKSSVLVRAILLLGRVNVADDMLSRRLCDVVPHSAFHSSRTTVCRLVFAVLGSENSPVCGATGFIEDE